MSPGTLQQSSIDKVGYGKKYEEIYFTAPEGKAGNYTVKTPLKFNSGTTLDCDRGAVINLVARAPTSVFGVRVPVFGQVEKTIEDITIKNIKFNGWADKQLVKHGKGYHNFIEFSRAKNIKIQNVIIENTQGDGARFEDSENIEYVQNTVLGCGHEGLYVDRCKNVLGQGNVTYLRSNSALRCKGSDNVLFKENTVLRTDDFSPAYSPGIQVQNTEVNETSKNVEIANNFISGTFGPGIWCAGFANKDIQAASGLNIHNNLITDCGNMPYENKISGVGGVVVDGWNGEIKNNTIDKCKGYGVSLGPYVSATPAGKGYSAKIYRNIITNTQKSNEVGTASGAAIANLVQDRYTSVEVYENCTSGNVRDYYGVTPAKEIRIDPLYAGDGDYHLKSTAGRYSGSQLVMDDVMSPCIFPEYELGMYGGTSEASRYTALPVEPEPVQTVYVVIPCESEQTVYVVIPCESEESAKQTADGHEGAFIIYKK